MNLIKRFWVTKHPHQFIMQKEGITVNENERTFLNGLCPYFTILEAVNNDYYDLMANNGSRELYQNAELLYQLATNLLRILPIRCNGPWLTEYTKIHLDTSSGILLLQECIPFLYTEFSEIISCDKSKYVLSRVAIIRNKYTHAPHTLHLGFSVGGKTSFSGGVWFEDNLLSVSTIWLSNIICKLNRVFDMIRDLFLHTVEIRCQEYRNHPYYKKISSFHFCENNERYGNIPWDWIDLDIDYAQNNL